MARTEDGRFIIMSAHEVCVGEDKAWKTILIYRAGEGIAIERRSLTSAKVERLDISLGELTGLAPAASNLASILQNADVPPVEPAIGSPKGFRASPARGNSPSSNQRGTR